MTLKFLEIIFIRSLACFDHSSEGWQDRKNIFSRKKSFEFFSPLASFDLSTVEEQNKENSEKRPYFRSQRSNLTKYMKGLIQKGFVEENWKEKKDKKNRPVKQRVYRLQQTLENFYNLNKALGEYSLDTIKSGKGGSLYSLYHTDYGKLMRSKFPIEKNHTNTFIRIQHERLDKLHKQRERIDKAIINVTGIINRMEASKQK